MCICGVYMCTHIYVHVDYFIRQLGVLASQGSLKNWLFLRQDF